LFAIIITTTIVTTIVTMTIITFIYDHRNNTVKIKVKYVL